MYRREVLAAFAASVSAASGCAGLFDGDDGGEQSTLTPADVPTASPTPTPGSVPADEASLADLETVPRTLALRVRQPPVVDVTVDAEFIASGTPESPATVAVTFTNDGSDDRQFRFAATPPLTRHRGESEGDAALLLAPAPDHGWGTDVDYAPERAGGCWRAGRTPPIPAVVHFVRLPPGQAISGTYHLLNAPGNDGCVPPGRYAFTASHGGRLVLDAWDRSAPGPDGESALADREVPALPDGPTRWYHEAGVRTPVYLEPDRERVEPPGAVTFTLVNRSRERLAGDRPGWRLYKLHDGSWRPLAPRSVLSPAGALAPGGTREWRLRLYAGAPAGEDRFAVGHLGGGTYAFRAGVRRAGAVYAALLAVDGPPAELAPSGRIVDVTREGDVVSVTSARYEATTDPTVVTARRVQDDPAASLVVEQVMQNPGLRNTLAFFEPDVREVRLQTDRSVAGRVHDSGYETRRFRFEGDAYAVTVESE